MAIKLNETVVRVGIVTNPETGMIELSNPPWEEKFEGESNTFRSPNLQKYQRGTRLEVYFRITKGQRTFVRARELTSNQRFYINVVDVEPGVNYQQALEYFIEQKIGNVQDFENSLSSYNKFSAFTKDPENLSQKIQLGLSYDEAHTIRHRLHEIAGEEIVFSVLLHDEDFPAPEGSIPGIEAIQTLEWVDNHWIPKNMRPIFLSSRNVLKNGSHINIMMTGESGYGKTSTCESLASWLGCDFIRVNCAVVMDTESWFGYHEARGGDTVFIPTKLTEKIRQGNCVILLDEANRIEPWVSNSLLPILDHSRSTEVHGEEIVAGEGIIFCFSVNIGPKFVGTNQMDAAMINRMDAVVEFTEPPRDIEEHIVGRKFPEMPNMEIRKIVSVISEVRKIIQRDELDIDASTRTSLKFANLVGLGMSMRYAAEYVLINPTPKSDRKSITDVVNSKLGPLQE